MSDSDYSDNLSVVSYASPKRVPLWIYDRKNGTYLNRTPTSWAKIIFYYICFYILLTGFFVAMMSIFLYFIMPANIPMQLGEQSLLKGLPGLGFRPNIDDTKTLIRFSPLDPQSYFLYTDKIRSFLDIYEEINIKPDSQFSNCSSEKQDYDINKVCKYKLSMLGECTSTNFYGYANSQPCILLKMNKIYGWMPSITSGEIKHTLVRCDGQNPEDNASLGEIKYFPSHAMNGTQYGRFDSQFFPYLGQSGYLSPIVAIKFLSPPLHRVVLVKCWLENADNVDKMPIRFELFVD